MNLKSHLFKFSEKKPGGYHFLWIISLIFFSTACGSNYSSVDKLPPGDTLTIHSDLLTMVDHGNGITSVVVKNPWDKKGKPTVYLLVDRNLSDSDIPQIKDARIIRVPVKSALVYSSVHTTPLEEMGAARLITGVADASYFTSPYILERLSNKSIVDVGNSLSPSFEKIVQLSPDVAIVSAYENAGHGILDNTGISIVDMTDYMETTPLGRAEWIVFLGKLFGRSDKAQSIFKQVVNDYNSLKSVASSTSAKPVVLTEIPYSGVWYQPGGQSYMSELIRAAGAAPLLSHDASTGSVQLDIASVLDKSQNADFWLIKTTEPVTAENIRNLISGANLIKAFNTGNIYIADTSKVPLYDDLAFHPERILADYVGIFHPELSPEKPKHYFFKVAQ